MQGRVIKSTGSWYSVITEKGLINARLRGKFKQDDLKLTNPIAVGDYVDLTQEEKQESYVITEIPPRENYIIRKSTRKPHFSHIIASNIIRDNISLFWHKSCNSSNISEVVTIASPIICFTFS
jgi:ribosome biogenesis GTPase